MTDLSQSAPDNQKEKILKLVEIWERGQTFPHDMLIGFKQQLNNVKNCKSHFRTSPLLVSPVADYMRCSSFHSHR